MPSIHPSIHPSTHALTHTLRAPCFNTHFSGFQALFGDAGIPGTSCSPVQLLWVIRSLHTPATPALPYPPTKEYLPTLFPFLQPFLPIKVHSSHTSEPFPLGHPCTQKIPRPLSSPRMGVPGSLLALAMKSLILGLLISESHWVWPVFHTDMSVSMPPGQRLQGTRCRSAWFVMRGLIKWHFRP